MRLLQLHIRNIASIEKADIDFENEPKLHDPDTGQPAQMFLIYGDTGTGKTVLLDAIAMALFGQTPRIEGVANKLRNTFTTSYGNEISINSIEQYTRLGITDKDECYSEVLFEGNDGQRYRARMQLGVTRAQNSRKKWLLQVGDEAEIQGNQCGEIIEKAIGMNFDQFSRMAMLAQGQFATFLCGDRKERASILEKLTNTSIFTRYGAAIKNILDRKKAAFDGAKKALAMAAKFDTEDQEELKKQLEEAVQASATARPERDSLSDRLARVNKLSDLEERRRQTAASLAELLGRQEGDTYKGYKALFTEWDATNDERAALERLRDSRTQLEKCMSDEAVLQATFGDLLSDLLCRENELHRKHAALVVESEWLDQRRGNEKLYDNGAAVCVQLQGLQRIADELANLQRDKTQCESQRSLLAKNQSDAVKAQEAAILAECNQQKDIDELSEKLQALNPDRLRNDLGENDRLHNAYVHLRDDHRDWLAKEEELKSKRANKDKFEAERDQADKACAAANARYQHDKALYERSLSRYTTMSASLDETLDNLRHQFSPEGGDICPLCGQPVGSDLLTREQFAALVTPLEHERDEAERTAVRSHQAYIAARDAASSIVGQLSTLTGEIETLTGTVELLRKQLDQRMTTAGIIFDSGAAEAIAAKITSLEAEAATLRQRQQEAEAVQADIVQRQRVLNELISARGQADLKVQEATAAVSENETRIAALAADIDRRHQEQECSTANLHVQLDSWMPGWKDNIATAERELKRQSDEYLVRRNACHAAAVALDKEQALVDSLTKLRTPLQQAHPAWTTAVPLRDHTLDDPLLSWTTLSQRCSAVAETADHCRATMRECQSLLDGWYAAHNTDEASLSALLGRKNDIAEARRYVAAIDTDIAKCRQTATDTDADIEEIRRRLELDAEAPLPDREALKAQLEAAEERLKEALARAAATETRLNTAIENHKKYEAARVAAEQAQTDFDHWTSLNQRFGGERFRNLVQTHILHPLLANANVYLSHITDRYSLICSEDNEQLSILVLDRYNRNEVRSVAVLSGGERFMISLALSLALSSLNRPDMNVDILFIDEGFGTLDQECLDSVMKTLGRLAELTGQGNRRVGIISHREELLDCIPNKIKLRRIGEGRSAVEVVCD